MKLSEDFIEKVREATNIVDIIEQYTQLKRSGSRATGLCPFPDHNEKTPSFSVSEDRQFYYCYGCRKGGNIYNFLREVRGMGFVEAVELLAEKAGIPMPKEFDVSATSSSRSEKKKFWKTNEVVAEFYHQELLKLELSHPVRAYCEKRGITQEIIEQFKIGYAPDQWENLDALVKSEAVNVEVLSQLGLLKQRKDNSGYYDVYRHRLMFPIRSSTGNYLGFGGRELEGGQTGFKDQPKYINSSESDIFNKSQILFGLNETARFIRSQDDTAIVVEGYMDFLALYRFGITNVVATLGTALTLDHVRQLKKYAKNAIILFDGDSAGQAAAKRSLPLLLSVGLIGKACILPNNLDPDDFLQAYGVDSMTMALKDSPEIFIWHLDNLFLNFRGSAGEKLQLIEKIGPLIKSIQLESLRELYLQEVADRFNEDKIWVSQAVSGLKAEVVPEKMVPETKVTPFKTANVKSVRAKISLDGAPKAELFLLNLALKSPQNFNKLLDQPWDKEMTHDGVRKCINIAEQEYRQMPSEFDKLTTLLMSFVEPVESLTLQLEKPFAGVESEENKKLMDDCWDRVHENHLRKDAKKISNAMRGQSQEEQLKQLERIMNIQKARRKNQLGKSE